MIKLEDFIDDIINVTAKAALNSYKFVGKGDKNSADKAAVDAMRSELNKIKFSGDVVIGEGEMDEAPMLYIGEKLGKANSPTVDIAVDPLDGTKLAAYNLPNAISVIAIAKSNTLLKAPDMYMEKVAIGPNLPLNLIDLDYSFNDNLSKLAEAKKKLISELCVCILDRPRHKKYSEILKKNNCNIKFITDGDVAGVIYAALKDSKVDMYFGIGGAPEGVLAAAAIKCLNGQFQGRLIFENEEEISRAKKMGITEINKKYNLNDIVKDDVIFSCSGVTNGELVKGVKFNKNRYHVETLLMHDGSKKITKLSKEYDL